MVYMPKPGIGVGEERVGDWIETYTGGVFWPLDPRPEEIDIEDIAHALSMMCRFNGHCSTFMSIGEHSVNVCEDVERKHPDQPVLALEALLHDGSEAYIADIVSPVKRHIRPWYGPIEDRLQMVIHRRYNLPESYDPRVKESDLAVLMTEARVLVRSGGLSWHYDGIEPAPVRIEGYLPAEAKGRFLGKFYELQEKIAAL